MAERKTIAFPGLLILVGTLTSDLCGQGEIANPSRPVARGSFPVRVHVFEDYETGIEKRWWLRGTIETGNLAPSLSASAPNTRACRAAPSRNFDRKMGDQSREWKAVIFNPVPGPPMGSRTRLSFRYRLQGTTTLRVQIYSLSNNYHRFLTDLPAGSWQQATVDLTEARRPDGSGGPLAADERIDDIQFYIEPSGDLLIDDIVLYEAADDDEPRPFPARSIFTGWFDTGVQGKEWPGEFEIVPHEKPRGWDAAKSVARDDSGAHHLGVNMRGARSLGKHTALFFRYRLRGPDGPVEIALSDASGRAIQSRQITPSVAGDWSETTVNFAFEHPTTAHSIVFTPPGGAELLVDDLLLYEPAAATGRATHPRGHGLAAGYPSDRNVSGHPAVLVASAFETGAWRHSWRGGTRQTVSLVASDPERKFEPLEGKALRIAVKAGGHYGASIYHKFAETAGGEPEEVYFRYYLRFADDWNPVQGGKLPGISGTYGRAGWGGRPSDGRNGWSARGLFEGRKDGRTPVGFYCYHADMKGKYGSHWRWDRDRLGYLANNRWYCLEQHARMNTPGKRDGVLRAWVDGQLAFEKTDVRMRDIPGLRIEQIWINLYHGGSWTATSDHHLYLDNVVVARGYIGPMVSEAAPD